MASTFTTNKTIEKPAHGDYNNDWDIPLNADMDDIDSALGGSSSVITTGLASGTYALSIFQYRPPNIIFSGSISPGVTLNFFTPAGVGGLWTAANFTSGSGTLTMLSGGGGPVVTIPRGQRVFVVSDGSSMAFAQTPGASSNPSQSVGLTAKNGTAVTFMTSDSAPPLDQSISPTWTGAHVFQNNVTLNNLLIATLTSSLTGNPGTFIDMRSGSIFAATPSPGDNTSRVATTAFVVTSFATLASPVLSGVPVSTTASVGNSTAQIATTAFCNPSSGSNANGRWRQNSDGTWMMWGSSNGQAAAPGTFTAFPTNFPNACESVVISPTGGGNATVLVYNDGGAHQTGTTGFWMVNGTGGTCFWIAMGH